MNNASNDIHVSSGEEKYRDPLWNFVQMKDIGTDFEEDKVQTQNVQYCYVNLKPKCQTNSSKNTVTELDSDTSAEMPEPSKLTTYTGLDTDSDANNSRSRSTYAPNVKKRRQKIRMLWTPHYHTASADVMINVVIKGIITVLLVNALS